MNLDVDDLFGVLLDLHVVSPVLSVSMRSEILKADLRYFWVEHSSPPAWARSSVLDRIHYRRL